jgi:hypothetical protein
MGRENGDYFEYGEERRRDVFFQVEWEEGRFDKDEGAVCRIYEEVSALIRYSYLY